jgi:hypothetical protein
MNNYLVKSSLKTLTSGVTAVYKASSTRAEGMGILCGVILAAMLGRKLRWYCDSKAAGDRYRKLDVMTPEEWEEVQSADVWREISHYKSIGPGVKVQWVTAHTDDKKRPHYLPPERRKAEHKINIVCDQLAGEHRDDVLETAPGGRANCAILCHGAFFGGGSASSATAVLSSHPHCTSAPVPHCAPATY